MSIITFKIDDRQLKRQLRKLARSVSDANVEKALFAGALVIQNEAKTLSPYDDGVLRQSIHVGGHTAKPGKTKDGEESHGDIGGNGKSGRHVQVLIGTDLVYSAIQEFGGSIKTTPSMIAKLRYLGYKPSSSLDYVHIPSQPYLRPAFLNKWKQAYRRIKLVLKSYIIRSL